MAISFPRSDIITAADWHGQQFKLVERQEYSRQANGVTIGKSFGSALWSIALISVPLERAAALDLEAMLRSLDGVINGFHAGDQRRLYPLAYPDGDFSESGVAISAVGSGNKSLRLDGLAAGFVLTRGDYLSVTPSGGSPALYQLMEAATADGSGQTPEFEVRPHLRPGTAIDDAVGLKKPVTVFTLEPDSISSEAMDEAGLNFIISLSAIQSV